MLISTAEEERDGENSVLTSRMSAYHGTAAAAPGYARAYRNIASIDLCRGEATVCLEIMPMHGREKINLPFAHARDGHALSDVPLALKARR